MSPDHEWYVNGRFSALHIVKSFFFAMVVPSGACTNIYNGKSPERDALFQEKPFQVTGVSSTSPRNKSKTPERERERERLKPPLPAQLPVHPESLYHL